MAETAKVPSKTATPAVARNLPSRTWPFEGLRAEIDRLFDEFPFNRAFPAFGDSLFGRQPAAAATIDPAFEVAAGDKAYVITAELPGLDQKDVEISIADGLLSVHGEKKEEREENKKDYFLAERRYGAFSRAFRLPDGIDEGKIEAEMKQGLLTITVPKSADAKQKERKVAIKS
jgi:HSP20 family protein